LRPSQATSSVDHATDALIQTAVRDKFAASTVLTIAHRLNTIMDADRVCVLEQGRIVELGPPLELIAADAEPSSGEAAAEAVGAASSSSKGTAETAEAVGAVSASSEGHSMRANGGKAVDGAASTTIKRGLFRSMHEASQVSHSHGQQRGAAL
jgi:ABC-type multidrug transport system ATPase subunit